MFHVAAPEVDEALLVVKVATVVASKAKDAVEHSPVADVVALVTETLLGPGVPPKRRRSPHHNAATTNSWMLARS